jgi:hypothetical protein
MTENTSDRTIHDQNQEKELYYVDQGQLIF